MLLPCGIRQPVPYNFHVTYRCAQQWLINHHDFDLEAIAVPGMKASGNYCLLVSI
jgi:hypothetical protein